MEIRGYRCIEELKIDIGSYTAFVGANGTGKSTVLYALSYFFNGGSLSADDLCNIVSDSALDSVSVSVTFDTLTKFDRKVLKSYAVGDEATFRRSWSAENGEKILGNAVQGPGFASVRQAESAKEMKEKYLALRTKITNLPPETVKIKILAALEAWEANPTNAHLLNYVLNTEANHLFGFNGEHTLSQLVRLVLVPAASDLANELGQNARGSALNALIGALMTNAVKSARDEWERVNETQLNDLSKSIKAGVTAATSGHAKHISSHLLVSYGERIRGSLYDGGLVEVD